MGRVLLCTGKTATIPYSIEKLGIRVWSVEELCYCLRENAFLLDQEIVSRRLTEWIENECGLPELAGMLHPLLHQKSSLAAFVVKILEYTGFYDLSVITQISRTLQSGAGLSDYEKKKKRGDFLVHGGKYSKALQEYEWLLTELPKGETEVRAGVLHNKGVALAGLFLFEKAAEVFQAAYQLKPEQEYFRDYLAAKRMLYDDKEYISFIAELPEAYDLSLQLEREVDAILEEWEEGEELSGLSELFALKEEGHKNLYYEEINVRTQALKERYREDTQM